MWHGGGHRFDVESEAAGRLRRWIAAGVPRQQSRRLTRLEVKPASQLVDRIGKSVALRAVAEFSDGSKEDVTKWTVFTSSDPAAVEIDPLTAQATLLRRGQHVVIARYLDRVLSLRLTVPLTDRPVDLSNEPRQNFIDELVLQSLSQLRLPVSSRCDDATFLRRVSLDLTGRLPTPGDVEAFLSNRDDDKRHKLVDRLLASEEFTEFWTFKFAKLLRIRSQPQDGEGALAFHGWLKNRFSGRRPTT